MGVIMIVVHLVYNYHYSQELTTLFFTPTE
jgi:hypothetical protein